MWPSKISSKSADAAVMALSNSVAGRNTVRPATLFTHAPLTAGEVKPENDAGM